MFTSELQLVRKVSEVFQPGRRLNYMLPHIVN